MATISLPRLNRQVLTTSRALEFCTQKELVLQTRHAHEQWPLVALKELIDNALDASEAAGIAPTIKVVVQTAPRPSITVTDNGPGIAPETVKATIDFSVRASSNEAYASPTRGGQGNALKTLIVMPFALDRGEGEAIIQAREVSHRITFRVDHIRQKPKIEHTQETSDVKNGTSVTLRWPRSACSILDTAKARFLQIAQDYAWLNPHLSITMDCDGEQEEIKATDPAWRRWLPSDPTPAHWYDDKRLERLIAAYVGDDQDHQRTRTVREFITEFRGMSASAKQKEVCLTSSAPMQALQAKLTRWAREKEKWKLPISEPVKAADSWEPLFLAVEKDKNDNE